MRPSKKILTLIAFIAFSTLTFAQSTTPFGAHADIMDDATAKKIVIKKDQKAKNAKDLKKLPKSDATKPKATATEAKKKEENAAK